MEKLTGKHFSEINKLVLKLRNEFNQKIEEQTDIIRKQRDRLEAQQEQIFNQRIIIEELAWQIRDLRDSVRKCSEQISNNVNAKYHVDTPENHLKLNIPEANDAKQSNHRAGRKWLGVFVLWLLLFLHHSFFCIVTNTHTIFTSNAIHHPFILIPN